MIQSSHSGYSSSDETHAPHGTFLFDIFFVKLIIGRCFSTTSPQTSTKALSGPGERIENAYSGRGREIQVSTPTCSCIYEYLNINRSLKLQIDDIREGRWDEAIAKELGIHPETVNAKPEEGAEPTETDNALSPEQMEPDIVPISDREVRVYFVVHVCSLFPL